MIRITKFKDNPVIVTECDVSVSYKKLCFEIGMQTPPKVVIDDREIFDCKDVEIDINYVNMIIRGEFERSLLQVFVNYERCENLIGLIQSLKFSHNIDEKPQLSLDISLWDEQDYDSMIEHALKNIDDNSLI